MPYHTYDNLVFLFKSLALQYEVIGQSVLGKDLYLFRIGNENANSIFFMGSIHGNEHSGAELLYYFANWLVKSNDPVASDLLANSQILILPVANPDGFEAWTRINANGVDLNRNFPKGWGGAGSNPGCGCTICRGNAEADQPEVQSILACWNKYQPTIGVTIHTGMELIAYPWGCWSTPVENITIYGGLYQAYKTLALQNGVEPYLFGQTNLSQIDLAQPVAIAQFPYSIYPACGDCIDTMQDRGMLGFTLEATQEFKPPYEDLEAKYFPRFLPFAITCTQSVYTPIVPVQPPPSPPPPFNGIFPILTVLGFGVTTCVAIYYSLK